MRNLIINIDSLNTFRHISIVIASCLVAILGYAANSAKNGPRILIVSSYNPDAMSTANTINAFVDYYNEHGEGGDILIENMNCKSLSEAHTWTNKARDIINKYYNTSHEPDLIVLLGQEAWASYLSLSPSELKLHAPVMCTMASRNIVRMPSDTCRLDTWLPSSIDYTFLRSRYNIVGGTLYEYDIDKNLDLIHKFYPDTKNIALLTDNSYGGLTLMAHVSDCMRRYPEYNLIRLDGRTETIYTISERIAALPEHTVMLVGTWRVDMTESYFVKNSAQLIKDANHKIPAFAISAVAMNNWALGGYMPRYRSQGVEIAQKVIDFFKDMKNGKVRSSADAVTVVDCHYVFDKAILDAWNVSSDLLPDDAEVVNFQPTFYQQYKFQIWIILAIFVMLVLILLIVLWFLKETRALTQSLKQSQAELIVAKEKAEESSKQKTAFLANMSHEIRTPLNAIVGFAEVLTTDGTLDERDKEQINNIIGNNSQMLLDLINDVLDMSRLESGRTKCEKVLCDVITLCADTLDTCKTAARRDDIDFILDADPNHLMAVIDKQHVRQVLINLISNSNKFTKSGSICLMVRLRKDLIEFSVADTGIGIPLEKQDAVFDRFEKLNESSKGFGIGLSLCKNIVTHLGGKIYVDSKYTKGARFVFTLPYVTQDEDDVSAADALG